MSFLQTLWSVPAILALTLSAVLIRRFARSYAICKIAGPPSTSWLKGNHIQFLARDAMLFQDEVADTYGKLFRITGYCGEQKLVISDTKALHVVLVKQLDTFDAPEYYLELRRLLLGRGVLSAPRAGGVHAKHRKLLNSAFAIAHLKTMVPLFHAICKQLCEVLKGDTEHADGGELDVLDYLGRGALELIGQAGFGYAFDALKGGSHEFSDALKRIVPAVAKVMKFRPLVPYLTRTFSSRVLRVMGELLPMDSVHNVMKLSDIMKFYATSIWEEKKRLHAEDKMGDTASSSGRDIQSILLRENRKAFEDDRLPDDELLAQVNTFLFSGTDTTSNALARILKSLADDQSVQDTLRRELMEATALHTSLDYEVLDRLPYLDAVCRETMRLYPPVRLMHRVAGRDAVLPLQDPVRDVDGNVLSEVFVPKGTEVICNIAAVNQDFGSWGADAREWKPERWLTPLPESVTDARIPGVLSNSLAFSGGGRACIGFKFSLLEMKAMLAQFIPDLRFEPSNNCEIVWRYGSIVTPSTSVNGIPQLPLRISQV
ncbi:unnamed protein product [Peniophora sp. CBMAI 1063]|nr:unnamed protein product [Peniophora sp. CBMAI 1063]